MTPKLLPDTQVKIVVFLIAFAVICFITVR